MKKEIVRREFLKWKIKGVSYSDCQKKIKEELEGEFTILTLKRWWKRFNKTKWDLKDKSTKPKTIHYKFSKVEKKEAIAIRRKTTYSAKQIRIKLQEKGIIMSESYIKTLVKNEGLSRGNKMEGIKLKWVRFERDTPNSMWQIDGTETGNGWILPIEDDCSRYCIAVKEFKEMTTANVIALLEEAITMHGKPREILTDNGPEFGGPKDWDSEFDKWCKKQGIKHIRSGVHKPTTIGKLSAIQQTIFRELPNWNNDLELWRYQYNHERPHQSLHLLTPATVYFQFKRHKKHYTL